MMCRRKHALFLSVCLLFATLSLGACARSPFPTGVSHVSPANTPCQLKGISWCSDGVHIAVGRHEGGGEYVPYGEIDLLDVASGGLVTLVDRARGLQIHPSCSPTGHQVAFHSTALSRRGIWIVDTSDSNMLQYVAEGDYPVWSPDGERMAFVRYDREYGNWTDTVCILDLETGDVTEVFTASAELTDSNGLAWSPDAQSLTFSVGTGTLAQHGVDETDIYVLDLETGELLQLTLGGRNDHPSWSPDGRLIAYMSGPTYGVETLVIARADGTCPVRPLEVYGLNWTAWSPDGTQIAFTWERGIYVMDIATVLGPDFLTTDSPCP